MSRSVLIVESTWFIRQLLKKNIESAGDVTVKDVFDAKEAREELKTGNFNLVILDLGIHGGDGLAFLVEMRTGMPGVPVVVLSSNQVRLKEAGNSKAADYLPVPVDMEQLKQSVNKILEQP